MIEAARLQHKIILSREGATQDRFGDAQETWSTYATAYAERVTSTSRDFLRADQEGTETNAVFRIRYRSGVSLADRVTDRDGNVFEIIEAVEIGRRHGLELRCKAGT